MKTLNDYWTEYMTRHAPFDVSSSEVNELRKAFYGGFVALADMALTDPRGDGFDQMGKLALNEIADYYDGTGDDHPVYDLLERIESGVFE